MPLLPGTGQPSRQRTSLPSFSHSLSGYTACLAEDTGYPATNMARLASDSGTQLQIWPVWSSQPRRWLTRLPSSQPQTILFHPTQTQPVHLCRLVQDISGGVTVAFDRHPPGHLQQIVGGGIILWRLLHEVRGLLDFHSLFIGLPFFQERRLSNGGRPPSHSSVEQEQGAPER